MWWGRADPGNVAGTELQRWHGVFTVGFSVMMVLDVALG